MSTAAAPQRSAPTRIDAKKWTRWLKDEVRAGGLTQEEAAKFAQYSQIPNIVMRILGSCGVPRTELLIVDNIMKETIGGMPDQNEQRPEWAEITEKQFGEWICVGETGVRKAVWALEKKMKLIEVQKVGRNSQYRILWRNILAMEMKRKRTVERTKDPIGLGDRTAVDVKEGMDVPMRFKEPVESVTFQTRVPGEFSLVTEVTKDGAVLRLVPKTTTPVTVSGEQTQRFVARKVLVSRPRGIADTAAPVANTATPVAVSMEDLKSFLTPLFLQLFQKPPDHTLLGQISRNLGEATIEEFDRVIAAKFRRKGNHTPGLFLGLAEDAAEAHQAYAAKKALEQPPIPAPSFVRESDDSTSEWATLRSHLRQATPPVMFENFFVQTRQVSKESGVLRVAAPDWPSAEALNEEYGPRITAAIAELDLDCVAVEFFPEGDV